jgi:hypothetical protein
VELSHWRPPLALLGLVSIGTSSARADHGTPEVKLPEPLHIASGWSMVLPLFVILAGFVLVLVGFAMEQATETRTTQASVTTS